MAAPMPSVAVGPQHQPLCMFRVWHVASGSSSVPRTATTTRLFVILQHSSWSLVKWCGCVGELRIPNRDSLGPPDTS
jgi:hypothetical protein